MPTGRDMIAAEQLRMLLRSPLPLHAGSATVFLAVLVLRHQLPPSELCGWAVLAINIQAARYWLRHRIRHLASSALVTRKWRWSITVVMAMAGLVWGLLGFASFQVPDVEMRIFVLFVVTSLMAGGLVSFTAYLPACFAFLLGAAVPLATAFCSEGTSSAVLMGGVAAAFFAALVAIGRGSNASVTALIELKFENSALVSDLRSARDAAEEASRIKSQFLANMSHELRTPLNAIIGFSDIVRNQLFGPLGNPRYEHYLSDIHQSGHHLLRLVNDILDISKLEAGAMEISESEVALEDIVVDSINLVSTQAATHGVSVIVDLPERVPRLRADELRLKQVVVNLLSNAVKFSRPGGEVNLSARLGPGGELAIAVRDSGIGMNAADIRIALQPFRQVENALSRTHEGTGLGLPLAKALIEKHGGTLRIASERDVGTTVTVTLPASRLLPAETSAVPICAAG
ncbi:MAG TPA: ATP-binding protein [Stellaceae bacterium]|nr:ATP-binding protein [Stellaceae bacterium]